MEAAITPGSSSLSVDLTRAAGVGDANQLEIQKAMGVSHREIAAMNADAAKISSDGVDVKA